MTRNPRTKKNLERKIVQLQIKLQKRQTRKLSRLANLRGRIQFYKTQLEQILVQESVSNASAGIDTAGSEALSTESSNS